MTVSAGPALLTGESGSTVKHLNWPIPACIPEGNYNVSIPSAPDRELTGNWLVDVL
jgi:hypothetical protein